MPTRTQARRAEEALLYVSFLMTCLEVLSQAESKLIIKLHRQLERYGDACSMTQSDFRWLKRIHDREVTNQGVRPKKDSNRVRLRLV